MSHHDRSSARVGLPAPSFELPCIVPGRLEQQRIASSDFAGRWLVLVFYPRDFSFVCPTELTALSIRIEDFRERNCDVLAVSVDTLESHRQWLASPAADGGLAGLRFSLGSDTDGSVASRFGVYVESEQVAGRGLFIIDPSGTLQYQVVHNLSVGRNVDETLRVLDALRNGGLCPESWTRADGTIDPRLDLKIGRVWGHYRIERLLGEGGFGWVHAARDLLLDRDVAIKLGRTSLQSTRREVIKEARAAAKLSHPNVCTILSVEEADGVPLIVMEYLPGGSLDSRLEAGALPPEEARMVTRQIVRGIAASHAAGIVHGDIKPANILFSDSGDAKVADFGMARHSGVSATDPANGPTAGDGPLDDTVVDRLSERVTAGAMGPAVVDSVPVTERITAGAMGPAVVGAEPVIRGTPSYMSPEQTEGSPPTAPSDVFSTGLVLYESFTGIRAVTGSSQRDVLAAVRELEPERIADAMPADIRELWIRMLAHRPADRPTMQEVAANLGG